MKPYFLNTIFYSLPIIPLIGILILGITSCLKPLDLDDVSEPQTVIEGVIFKDSLAQVRISESISKTSENVFPIFTNASVILKSNDHMEILEPDSEGIFVSKVIKGEVGKTYELTVEYENKVYEATTSLPEKNINISTIGFQEVLDFSSNPFYLEIDFFAYSNIDNSFNSSHGLFNLVQNGTNQIGKHFFFDAANNHSNPVSWTLDLLQKNDSLKVELFVMDERLYQYFFELNEVTSDLNFVGLSVAPPVNIHGNFGDEILGYFGAFQKETRTFIAE